MLNTVGGLAAGVAGSLREVAGGVADPVDAVEDVESLRRVALDGENMVCATALRDQRRRFARRAQRGEGDRPAADIAAFQEVLHGCQLAFLVAEVQKREGRVGCMVNKGHCLVVALAIALGTAAALAVGVERLDGVDPGTEPAASHVLQCLETDPERLAGWRAHPGTGSPGFSATPTAP